MEETVTLTCKQCGLEIKRRRTEHRRTKRRGRGSFCGLACSVTWGNEQGLTNPKGTPANLSAANRRDELTPFRYFKRVCQRRKHVYSLDLAYLKSLWENQEGKCPITGWTLNLPIGTGGFEEPSSPRNASLDRIDQDCGYIEGNVRYVALIVNLARTSCDDDVRLEFAEATVIQRGRKD